MLTNPVTKLYVTNTTMVKKYPRTRQGDKVRAAERKALWKILGARMRKET